MEMNTVISVFCLVLISCVTDDVFGAAVQVFKNDNFEGDMYETNSSAVCTLLPIEFQNVGYQPFENGLEAGSIKTSGCIALFRSNDCSLRGYVIRTEEPRLSQLPFKHVYFQHRHYYANSFRDCTEEENNSQVDQVGIDLAENTTKFVYPTLPHYQNFLQPVFLQLNKSRMESFVKEFTAFNGRFARNHYNSSDNAENWLNQEIKSVVDEYEGSSISIRKIADPLKGCIRAYNQENIIVHLEGLDPVLKDEVVILGAHFDTIHHYDTLEPNWSPAPGADDNAAGCAVLLEVLRLIIQMDIKFKRTVEFHWYAAEELGLRGSHDVVEQYLNERVKVKGMLNVDAIGNQDSQYGKTIRVYSNATDPELTAFVKMLIGNYLPEYEIMEGICGFGCTIYSDHVSWTLQGYPATFVTEAVFSPYLHTIDDTIEKINFEQVHEFSKLAVAFVTELAEVSQDLDTQNASLATSFLPPGWINMLLNFFRHFFDISMVSPVSPK